MSYIWERCPGICNTQFRSVAIHLSLNRKCREAAEQKARESHQQALDADGPHSVYPTRQENPYFEADNDFVDHGSDLGSHSDLLHPRSPTPNGETRPLKRRRVELPAPLAAPTPAPAPAPPSIKKHLLECPQAGKTYGDCQTPWEELRAQEENAEQLYAPYWTSAGDWEIAQWLASENLSLGAIDKFLATSYTKPNPPSFKSGRDLRAKIEALPPVPKWKCCTVTLPDAPSEPQVLLYRDIYECIDYLLANPTFREDMTFVPFSEFVVVVDEDGEPMNDRRYSEMWTANKWHEVQLAMPDGITILAIIIGSDATHTSNFSGDRKVHPLYISLGNIAKATRAKPSRRAFLLLAYLPVTSFQSVPNPKEPKRPRKTTKPAKKRANPLVGILRTRLLHTCLRHVTEPLRRQGKEPRLSRCSDGKIRNTFAFLAAHIADLEEQWELACSRSCPHCIVDYNQLGLLEDTPLRMPDYVLSTIREVEAAHPDDTTYEFAVHMSELHLLGVHKPYWEGLPFFDFGAFCSDVLHGLHKYFYDHVFQWCVNIIGFSELDKRLKLLPHYPGFRAFKNGVSKISQWSGKEHRDLQRYVYGAVVDILPTDCVRAVRADLDFIYLAQYRSQTNSSLSELDGYLAKFHDYKSAFTVAGGRVGKKGRIEHFNIPKLHNKKHFISGIIRTGTTDNYTTEITERYHIDYAKDGVPMTNRKTGMEAQLVRWLARCEKIHSYAAYIHWHLQNWPKEIVQPDGHDPDNEDGSGGVPVVCDAMTVTPVPSATALSMSTSVPTPSISPSLHYRLNLKPDRAKASTRDIDIGECPGLISGIVRYLTRHPDSNPHTSILPPGPPPTAADLPAEFFAIDCWDQMTLTLPTLDADDPLETRRVRARSVKQKDGPVLAQYDPVFIDVDPASHEQNGVNGLRAAQVRLIFRPANPHPKQPHPLPKFLAFVHWFSLLDPPNDALLYSLHRPYRANGSVQSDVIEVLNIIRPCPLIPHIPKRADDLGGPNAARNGAISGANCLEKTHQFYVNCFHCKPTYQTIF